MWESCRRGRLTLIVGVNVAPPALSSGLVGEQGNRRAIPFARPCDGACVDNGPRPPACVTAAGGADPFVSVALATARTQWLRSGPASWSRERCCMDCVTKNLQLPACSPLVGDGSGSRCSCGVSFSAPAVSWGPPPNSWSLQLRCSAVMTRCGRARLAAGATEIVSTPRLVGIRALCRWSQYRLGAASL
jgi:hypothetical protein